MKIKYFIFVYVCIAIYIFVCSQWFLPNWLALLENVQTSSQK